MNDQQKDRIDHLTRCDQLAKQSRNAAISGIAALAATVALLDLNPTEVTDLLPGGVIYAHVSLVGIIIGATFSSRQAILSATKKPSTGEQIESDTVDSWTKKSRVLHLLGEIALALAGGEILIILAQRIPA